MNRPSPAVPACFRSIPKRLLLIGAGCALLCSSAMATDYTWDGGGGNDDWGTGQNWVGDSAPSPGSGNDLHFAGSTRLTPFNNYTAFDDFRNILFDSGASSFTISGHSLDIFGKIENNSSVVQTFAIDSFSMNSSSGSELDPTLGDLTISVQSIFNNGNNVHVFGSSGKTLTINNTGGSGLTGPGNFIIEQNSTVVLTGSNNYSGNSEINAGILETLNSNGFGTGAVFVGNGTTPSTSATLLLTADNLSVGNTVIVNPGNANTRTVGGNVSSGNTSTYTGNVYLGNAAAGTTILRSGTSGGTVAFDLVQGSTANISGPGIVALQGTLDNNNLGAIVGDGTANSGTLLLAKTNSGNSSHSLGAGLTVNGGGTVMLGGAGGDQIYDPMAVTLNGGSKFATAGLSEGTRPTNAGSNNGLAGIGALTLQSTSSTSRIMFDFGSGPNGSTLAFSSLSGGSGAFVDILNWTGSNGIDNGSTGNDRLLFSSNPNLSDTALANFAFYDDAGSPFGTGGTIISYGNMFELVPVPVPEPATWIAAGLTMLALGFTQRRRLLTMLPFPLTNKD